MSDAQTVEDLLQTVDRLTRRVNSMEQEKRIAPPFDLAPKPPPKSPAQQFQEQEHAAHRLTPVVHPDEVGRPIKRWFGDPELVWGPFKVPSKLLVGISTKS
jgi:hypothetical protein